ncbi:MAG: nitroreductase-like oxidoreductase [Eubacterium sp.]|nr:nitroreductase-like oxidoreductase [Eubacterium sp.]
MSKDFYNALKDRRTYYGISKEATVSDDRIQEVINDAVMHTPTAFNSQSGRVIVLFGQNHDKLWDIAKEELRKIVPAENFSSTEEKINSFKSGYGTVLFFEDQTVIESLQQQFALYKDNFPVWSLESNGMLQFVVWTSLETEGLSNGMYRQTGSCLLRCHLANLLQHLTPNSSSPLRAELNFSSSIIP